MRLPCNPLRAAGLPALGIARGGVKSFEFFGGGLRTVGSQLMLHCDHDRIVPGKMQIRLRRNDVDCLAGSAPVCVSRGMQRLMDIGHEMNEEGEIACGAPFVELPDAQPMRVLVDFGGYAVSIG